MKYLTYILVCICCAIEVQALDVIWDREGATESAHFGGRIWPLGDQNDDGYDDWSVMSPGGYVAGEQVEFRIELFHGGDPPPQEPYMTFLRDPETMISLNRGYTLGDVNGDGYVDWVISYIYIINPDSFSNEIYFGGPDADQNSDVVFMTSLLGGILPWGGRNGFGFDFNGDRFSDIYLYHQVPEDYGQILFGGPNMDTIPDWQMSSIPNGQQIALPESFGDINGDGYDDIISTDNHLTHTSYIYLGSQNPDTIPDYEWYGFQAYPVTLTTDLNSDGNDDLIQSGSEVQVFWGGDEFDLDVDHIYLFEDCDGTPYKFTNGGDFNDDGYDDIAIVHESCNLGWGKLNLYLGHRWPQAEPAFTIDGRTYPLYLVGICEAVGVGDVNNDGIEDLAIGAQNTNTDGRRGRVVILSGDRSFVVPADEAPDFHPSSFRLHPCYPNPFNPATTISFDLTHPGMVKLTVFDVTGRRVTTLLDEPVTAGAHQTIFDGAGLSSGIYFARLEAGSQLMTRKMILLK